MLIADGNMRMEGWAIFTSLNIFISLTVFNFLSIFTFVAIITSLSIVTSLTILELVENLITRWHHLRELKSWPPGGTACISWKFGHKSQFR